VFLFNLPKCLFVIIVIYVYFTYILQGSVKRNLRCGGIFNNHMIANCSQSEPVKRILIIGLLITENIDKSKVARFLLARGVHCMSGKNVFACSVERAS